MDLNENLEADLRQLESRNIERYFFFFFFQLAIHYF